MKKLDPEIILLAQFLRDCAVDGKLATYDEMASRAGGLDIQKKYRYKLSRALELAKTEYKVVFVNRMGVGYQPVASSKVATQVTQKRQARIESETNRWESELDIIKPQELKAGELKDYLKCQLKLCAQRLVISAKAQMKLEQKAENSLPRYTGLEFAKEAALALRDVS